MVVPSTRVLVLDACEIERVGLRTVLGDYAGISVVAESGDLEEAIKLAEELRPSVIVMDLAPPHARVYDVVRLVGRSTGAKCLAFSDSTDWHSVASWIRAGGKGYVPRHASASELIRGILRVAQGEVFISPLIRPYGPSQDSGDRARLSPREREILVLVAMGLTSPEISERLFISHRTVENHRDRIRRKLGIRSRTEFVQYATEHGLFESA